MNTPYIIKPLDRWNFGAKFTISFYTKEGSHLKTFNVQLDSEDGGWICDDPDLDNTDLIYYGAFELAQCMFNEEDIQIGSYEEEDFGDNPDFAPSKYAWIISAI